MLRGRGKSYICVAFLRDTNEEIFTFPLEYGSIWNQSGLQRKKQEYLFSVELQGEL